jgi:hypothetical protein
MSVLRHAVYWIPEPGPLAAFGAAWLGWDVEAGRASPCPEVPGLPRALEGLTAEPRRYGLHATLKAPFRLRPGRREAEVAAAVARLAARLAPARAEGLALAQVGRVLALVPEGDPSALGALAAEAVASLDALRAPASPEELARRRAAGLSPVEEANLVRWGYPYVMGAFRFHVTLTGPLGPGEAGPVLAALAPRLRGVLPRPFAIESLAHVGEGGDGRFRLIGRHPLRGAP